MRGVGLAGWAWLLWNDFGIPYIMGIILTKTIK